MSLTTLMEACPQNPEEIAFANHFFEGAQNLYYLLNGGVTAKLFRVESPNGKLRGQFLWQEQEVGVVTFRPTETLIQQSEFSASRWMNSGKTSLWKEWLPKFLKPAAIRIIENELQDFVHILKSLGDQKTAEPLERLFYSIHPEWYYFDC